MISLFLSSIPVFPLSRAIPSYSSSIPILFPSYPPSVLCFLKRPRLTRGLPPPNARTPSFTNPLPSPPTPTSSSSPPQPTTTPTSSPPPATSRSPHQRFIFSLRQTPIQAHRPSARPPPSNHEPSSPASRPTADHPFPSGENPLAVGHPSPPPPATSSAPPSAGISLSGTSLRVRSASVNALRAPNPTTSRPPILPREHPTSHIPLQILHTDRPPSNPHSHRRQPSNSPLLHPHLRYHRTAEPVARDRDTQGCEPRPPRSPLFHAQATVFSGKPSPPPLIDSTTYTATAPPPPPPSSPTKPQSPSTADSSSLVPPSRAIPLCRPRVAVAGGRSVQHPSGDRPTAHLAEQPKPLRIPARS